MKTIASIFIFIALPFAVNAQSIIDKLYDKYSGAEGYTAVYISKYMFQMFQDVQLENNEVQDEMQQALSNLDCIKILARDDDPKTSAPVNLYNETMKLIPSSVYKEIMVVKEGNQNVNMYVKEDKNKVAELLLIVGGADEDVLISIQGIIDMKNISKLAGSMNIQGLEKLENIE